MAQMLAAARISAIDALFGLVARNDAEGYQRELLGRSKRRDRGALNFRKQIELFGKIAPGEKNVGFDALGILGGRRTGVMYPPIKRQ